MVPWCFNKTHTVEDLIALAPRLGLGSIELCDPKFWPQLHDAGLTCAIAGSHGFKTGPNHRGHWETCRRTLTERLDQCREHGVKNVISFIGMADGPDGSLDRATGLANAEAFFAEFAPAAEAAGVTVCIEMLNTRDDSHPMKGHPGYQGDDIDEVVALTERIGSPAIKVLFDVYHVQIMNGDVIRRIARHAAAIGHVHTAGNPGRGELDDTQELNYRPIVAALRKAGYGGFLGHEFIPTGDPVAGLEQAIAVCGGAAA